MIIRTMHSFIPLSMRLVAYRLIFKVRCEQITMIADVYIELKEGVADPEGEATLKALRLLGFKRVRKVSTVKVFRLDIEARSKDEAEREIAEMCEKLLANPVIQKYRIEWRE